MKLLALLGFLILIFNAAYGQSGNRLTQSFTESTYNIPPTGWQTQTVDGDPGIVEWRFDNPGGRAVSSQMVYPYAILDAGYLAASDEKYTIALVSPRFDLATGRILLMFDHIFDPEGEDALVKVQAFNGRDWVNIPSSIYGTATDGVKSEIIEITDQLQGVTIPRIRFIWEGSNQGFWAIDNIKVFDAFQLDAGLAGIPTPVMPFTAASHMVSVNLTNFGSDILSEATVGWQFDGGADQLREWNDSLGFGQSMAVDLAEFVFDDRPVNLKVWLTSVNGMTDANPENDTLEITLRPAMQGNYTIGGESPDFIDFEAAANALNTAGVAGSINFLVRPQDYLNLFYLGNIPEIEGIDDGYTILFESDGGDAHDTRLVSGDYGLTTLNMRGTRNIHFRGMGFSGYNAVLLDNQASNVEFDECRFAATNSCVLIKGGANNILLQDNHFTGSETSLVVGNPDTEQVSNIRITGCHFSNSHSVSVFLTNAYDIDVHANLFTGMQRGILARNAEQLAFLNNRIHVQSEFVHVNAGIRLENVSSSEMFNNHITAVGLARADGIILDGSNNNMLYHNSLNISTNDVDAESRALWIIGGNANDVRNNIFHIDKKGFPAVLSGNPGLSHLDHNNYHSPQGLTGRVGATNLYNIEDWWSATGMDGNSISVHPFFAALEYPEVGQSALQGAASLDPAAMVDRDIDNSLRSMTPTIGAKEFVACDPDAGINDIISPSGIVSGSPTIEVLLFNHGTQPLHSVEIFYQINDGPAQSRLLDGSVMGGPLASGASHVVTFIAGHDFSLGGQYLIRAWTHRPNGADDCRPGNDSLMVVVAGAMCADYSVGGEGADFKTITDAVQALTTAGATCDVTFRVNDGVYEEQFVIEGFAGDEDHMATFVAASGPGSVTIDFPYWEQAPVTIRGARNLRFNGIRFSGHHALVIEDEAEGLNFELCHFSVYENPLATNNACVDISGGSGDIRFAMNHFEDGYHSVKIHGTDQAAMNIEFVNNLFESSWHEAISVHQGHDVKIDANVFTKIRRGILAGSNSGLQVSNNRFYISPVAAEDNIGIHLHGGGNTQVFNNFIASFGQAATTGIRLSGTSNAGVFFNSIHIANSNVEGFNRGLMISGGSGTTVYNNIFMVDRQGFPVWLDGSNPGLRLNHNNYYSNGRQLGMFNGDMVATIDNWRVATGQDAASLSVNPFFSSDGLAIFNPFFGGGPKEFILFPGEGPVINQVLLSGTGIPVPGITTDIANEARDPDSPGIGARVYTQCENDAGISRFLSPPGLVSGTQEVRVELQNHGSNNLGSVTIRWEINGIPQAPVPWTAPVASGPLEPGGLAGVTLGTFTFTSGSYTIRAWTENPNGQADCNDENNLFATTAQAGLNGPYTIGGFEPDFENFRLAAEALNVAGITGDVTFFVRDGFYPDPFIIGDFYRASEDYKVTFVEEDGIDPKPTISQPPQMNFSVKLQNTRNIYFDRIKFDGLDAVVIESSENISFNGCDFDDIGIGVEITTGGNNIEFLNNKFESGINAIILRPGLENVSIIGNNFFGQTNHSIHAHGTNGLIIRENRFEQVTEGLLVIDASDVVIRECWVFITETVGTQIGLEIRGSNQVRLFNNFVYSRLNSRITGIELFDNTDVQAVYNTVSLMGNDPGSRAFSIIGGNRYLVKNNIFSCLFGFPVYIDQNPGELSISFNNYYNQNPGNLIGSSNGIPYSDMALWRLALADNNSLTENPGFAPPNSPRHNNDRLKNAAEPTLVTRDIFGVSRHPNTPAMGCFEPFTDYGIVDMRLPPMDCNTTSINEVSLLITQSGHIPRETMNLAFFATGMSDTLYIDVSGFEGNEIWWTINEIIDLALPGEYLFRAWLPDADQLGDQFPANDTITHRWTKSKPPDVSAVFEYACESVKFTGTVIPVASDLITSNIWSFGDRVSVDPVTTHRYDQAGVYTVTFEVTTESGCVVEKQLEVQAVDQRLEATELLFQPCFGQKYGVIEIDIEGGLTPYYWSLNGSTPAVSNDQLIRFENLVPDNYTILITDSLNCEVEIAAAISELPALNPLISGPDSIYIPANVQFNFSTSLLANSYHVWTLQGNGVEMTSDETILDYRFDSIGTYTVTLEVFSGPSGECSEDTVHVIHAKLKPLTLGAEVIQQYCKDESDPSITLFISGGVPPYSIVINNQQPPVETSDTTWLLPNPVPGETYLFSVTDTYNQEQTFTTSLVVPVAINPTIYLTDENGDILTGEYTGWVPFEVILAFSYEDQPDSLVWKMLTGTLVETLPETGAELTLTFEEPGEYIIVLETFTGEPSNCFETAEFRIIADLKVEIITNDIITPNGDGVDDYFEVKHRGILDLQMDIFDRRGRKVFSHSGLEALWDGNYDNGRPAPDGMYPYHISTIGYDRLLHKKSGVIRLIRDAVQVFPNPASTMITIDSKGNLTGPVDVEFVNLAGNRVMIIKNLDLYDLVDLDISNLQEGLYLVSISDQNNVFHNKLRIIR